MWVAWVQKVISIHSETEMTVLAILLMARRREAAHSSDGFGVLLLVPDQGIVFGGMSAGHHP